MILVIIGNNGARSLISLSELPPPCIIPLDPRDREQKRAGEKGRETRSRARCAPCQRRAKNSSAELHPSLPPPPAPDGAVFDGINPLRLAETAGSGEGKDRCGISYRARAGFLLIKPRGWGGRGEEQET